RAEERRKSDRFAASLPFAMPPTSRRLCRCLWPDEMGRRFPNHNGRLLQSFQRAVSASYAKSRNFLKRSLLVASVSAQILLLFERRQRSCRADDRKCLASALHKEACARDQSIADIARMKPPLLRIRKD